MSNFLSPIDEDALRREKREALETHAEKPAENDSSSEDPAQEIHRQRDEYLRKSLETMRGRDFHCC